MLRVSAVDVFRSVRDFNLPAPLPVSTPPRMLAFEKGGNMSQVHSYDSILHIEKILKNSRVHGL